MVQNFKSLNFKMRAVSDQVAALIVSKHSGPKRRWFGATGAIL
jgi:hypothetical protein